MFQPVIKRIAHSITDDPDHRDDLIQSATIEFWELDPTRIDVRDQREIAYVREILVRRMWKVWGKEHDGEQKMAAGLGRSLPS